MLAALQAPGHTGAPLGGVDADEDSQLGSLARGEGHTRNTVDLLELGAHLGLNRLIAPRRYPFLSPGQSHDSRARQAQVPAAGVEHPQLDRQATWAARSGETGTGRTSLRHLDMASALVNTGRAMCPSGRLTASVAAS